MVQILCISNLYLQVLNIIQLKQQEALTLKVNFMTVQGTPLWQQRMMADLEITF